MNTQLPIAMWWLLLLPYHLEVRTIHTQRQFQYFLFFVTMHPYKHTWHEYNSSYITITFITFTFCFFCAPSNPPSSVRDLYYHHLLHHHIHIISVKWYVILSIKTSNVFRYIMVVASTYPMYAYTVHMHLHE